MAEMIRSSDGVRVALHDLGGNGPPLLVLHATGFHGRCYTAIAELLHEHFRVWAPDLRGHGDTETPDIALPWSGMVDDALAVIDHLAIAEPVRAVGHSMGGAAVIGAELRRPGMIRAAWLYEPIVVPFVGAPASAHNPMAAAARQRRHDFASFTEVIERYSGRAPFAHVDPRVLRDYVEHGWRATPDGVTLKTTGESEARVFEGIDLTLFEHLAAVRTPIMVVGSGDGQNPARFAPLVAAELPNGTLSVWSDRSHFGPFEDPARAAAAIIDTLS